MHLGYIGKILLVIAVFCVCALLFRRASGTLSIKKLNIISLSFYWLLIFCLIGGSIVFLGFQDHYLIAKVNPIFINKAYGILVYTVLALPFFVCIFNYLYGIKDYNLFYSDYISRPVELLSKEKTRAFFVFLIATIICGAALIYTFYHIGYIALFEMLKGNFELLSQRISISRGFDGNEYIRNVFALGLTPLISYIVYIYSRVDKGFKWKLLFLVLFFLSVLAKTYDFSKAPVIWYIFYFFIIEVLLGKIKRIKKVLPFLLIAAILILVMYYVVAGYSGKLFSLTNGPISRTFITSIAGLFLHVQTFPEIREFLVGASFPHSFAMMFNLPEYGIRSGRVMMEVYMSHNVQNNTAGVMNTIFTAEAYANFGMLGVIVAPIIAAFVMGVIPTFVLKQRKTPLFMGLYIFLTYTYVSCLTGGFVDYVYSVSIIIMVTIIGLMLLAVNKGKIFIKTASRFHS